MVLRVGKNLESHVDVTRRCEVGILELGLWRHEPHGIDGARGLQNVIDLACQVDELGYDRLWLSEHRTAASCYGSPLALLSVIVAKTSCLRVGTGGLLLGLNDQETVVDTMAALDALFPGRIECGVCRGPERVGVEQSEGSPRLRFEIGVAALQDALADWRYARSLHGLQATRPGVKVWLLGTSRNSAEAAARLGVAFAYSLCHRAEEEPEVVIEAYRNHVARCGGEGKLLIAASMDLQRENKGCASDEWERSGMTLNVRGPVDECADQLFQIGSQFGAACVLIADMIESHSQRCEMYVQLMQEFKRMGYEDRCIGSGAI